MSEITYGAIVPLSEVVEGVVVVPSETTIDPLDAFEWFMQIDVANGDATQDTVAAYRREVGMWIAWCEKRSLHPLMVERDDVERYRAELKKAGIAVSTRATKLSIIRRFYAAAVRHRLIQTNPVEGVRAGKDLTAPEDKMKALSHQGLSALVASMPNENLMDARDRAIVGLMALHGLRRIEVHRLNHESLRLDSDTPFLEVEGKGSKLRRAYLRTDTLAAVENYARGKMAAGLPVSGAFFVSHSNNGNGNRLSRQALNEIADKHLSAAGLKKVGVSCHALRHTFGTLAVSGGAKIEHLRDAMGHSDIETTSIYVRAVEKAKNNPAQFIDIEL
ncbi:tyrosine recombinase XerD [Abditibacteriota bacterium]|nr:tyrosine recombinase XerD [Abditibacteriota bacterium]